MTTAKLQEVSKLIADQVIERHAGRKTWSKVCGQWLVYGFESKLGFSGSVGLCGIVENAYKKKQDIGQAIFEYLRELFVQAGQFKD